MSTTICSGFGVKISKNRAEKVHFFRITKGGVFYPPLHV
jgi:hypothetical protein